MSELASSFGGRVELLLVREEGLGASYSGEFFEGERGFQNSVSVSAEGKVTHADWKGESAPGWMLELTQSLLRTTWRQRGMGTPWPRRLTRWRKGTEGT